MLNCNLAEITLEVEVFIMKIINNNQNRNNIVSLPTAAPRECSECGSNSVLMSWQKQIFDYVDNGKTVRLQATVPVWSCKECHDEYTDDLAEDIRHETVCHYLGRLSPREIKAIRESYDMSQAEFAEISRFGIASIKRWETGSLIQGAAQDAYLRLLAFPSNIAFVQGLSLSQTHVEFEFRTSISTEVRAAAEVFQLRKHA